MATQNDDSIKVSDDGAPWMMPLDHKERLSLQSLVAAEATAYDRRKALEVSAAQYNGSAVVTPLNRSEEARAHIAEALRLTFPDGAWDDSVEASARRVLGYWTEYAASPATIGGPLPFNFTTFPADHGQLVVVADIEFESLCSHHLLPILGRVHIGYIPAELQVGLSKLPRLVEHWAHQPIVQERLTYSLVHDIKARLHPQGVMVVVEAQHTCMCARGIRTHRGIMRTSLPQGLFMSSDAARTEFFTMIARPGV